MKHLIRHCASILILSLLPLMQYASHAPRLAVIFVIDQLPYRIIEQIQPNLSGGIKYLLRHGINYTQVYMPHASPETAVGHAALNTGSFAKDHGIVANAWYDAHGKKIAADDDFSGQADIFESQTGIGKSAKNLMVDGISDTICMHSSSGTHNKVLALSLKSRAAIMCAGHLGKAIWFDEEQGIFTSSKAFYQELPSWLTCFNEHHKVPSQIMWRPMHCLTSRFYNRTSCGSSIQLDTITSTLFDTQLPSYTTSHGATSYRNFMKSPDASQMLLDLAYTCIEQELSCNKEDKLVVWVSISSTDFIGHEYGTQSDEYTDLIYQVDCQLKKFIRQVTRLLKSSDILWVLTSDHGSAPIPEIIQQEGYLRARRIDHNSLQESLNENIAKEHRIENAVAVIDSSNIYLNTKKIQFVGNTHQDGMYATLRSMLLNTPGIKRVWIAHELQKATFDPYTLEYNFQQQFYPGRSGDLIFQLDPYCVVSKYKSGTAHGSPYNYDTHVPLVIYQKGEFEQKIINETVLSLQFAPTLAHILKVPKPSTCTFNFLPGSIPHEIYA